MTRLREGYEEVDRTVDSRCVRGCVRGCIRECVRSRVTGSMRGCVRVMCERHIRTRVMGWERVYHTGVHLVESVAVRVYEVFMRGCVLGVRGGI